MGNFDRIIGYEDIKAELIRFADVIKNTGKYSRIGVTLPSGLLIYGDPGLGKSLMAKCFIEEAGCRTYTIRKEKPNGDFVKEIKEVFEMAKDNAPSIVFLDDMDKFANEDYSHKDAEEYVTVQSCIDECRGYGVFVLATVNDKYSLPDSLLRAGRFDETISVGIPKPKDAEKIIDYFLDQKQVTGNIDIEELTRLMEGQSCAELETVINKAGIYAGFDGREKINQDDIVKAVLRMMFDSPESVNPSEYRNTKYLAIHEAGHHQLIYKNLGDGCKFHMLDHTKTDAGVRVIPLTSAVCSAFVKQREYQFLLGIDHDIEVDGYRNFVFTSRNGTPLAPNAVNSILYNIVDAYNKREATLAGEAHRKPLLLPKISSHIMRHTGCTRMAESGMDPKVLQYLMGHVDFSVTMNVYNHISNLERIKKEVMKLEENEFSLSV